MSAQKNWRSCYRHVDKPAIRDCSCCGRPICRECGIESGDVSLCLPCKESLSPVEEEPAAGERFEPLTRPAAGREARVIATELTILEDGKIQPPDKRVIQEEAIKPEGKAVVSKAAGKPAKEPVSAPKAPTGSTARLKTPVVPPEPARAAGKAIPVTGVKASGKDSRVQRAARKKKKAPPVPARAAGKAIPVAGVKASGKDSRVQRAARKKKEAPKDRKVIHRKPPSAPGGARRAGRRLFKNVTSIQLVSGLPYAVLAGILVYVFWLLLAFFGTQWTQFAVLTCGIAVPWALFKGATAGKRDGRKVRLLSPRPVWMSVSSVIIVTVLTPPVELLAYKIVYRSSTRMPFSDFIQRYLQATDWVLIASGLALAFLIPFLLKASERWKEPVILKRNGAKKKAAPGDGEQGG